jgi:hypothetical protein
MISSSNSNGQSIGLMLVWCVDWFDSGTVVVHVKLRRPGLTLLAKQLVRHWHRRRPHAISVYWFNLVQRWQSWGPRSVMSWSNSNCQSIGSMWVSMCRNVWQLQSCRPRKIWWHPGLTLHTSWVVQLGNWFDSGKVWRPHSVTSWSTSNCWLIGLMCRLVRQWHRLHSRKIQYALF